MPEGSADLSAYRSYLQERNVELGVPTAPPPQTSGEAPQLFFQRQQYLEASGQNVLTLAKFTDELGPNRIAKFLSSPYVYEYLPLFLERNPEGQFVVQPETVDLALEVSDKIDTLANIYGYETQYIQALNAAGFTAAEFIRRHSLRGANPEELLEKLSELEEEAVGTAARVQEEKQLAGRGNIRLQGEKSIIRHLKNYAEQYDPEIHGEFEDFVLKSLTHDVHRRLVRVAEDYSYLNQPQGVEVEVLKHIIRSQKARERGVEHWMPRGVPWENLQRKDWYVVPLLGISEDVGERPQQRFEVSTDPSETMAPQTTTIFSLVASGFFTERELSNVFEGYSLHVSTIFPTKLLTRDSLSQYRTMARSLAGAFASDQRIGFGGFMSGGDEVSDKSTAGTMREVSKVKDVDPRTKALLPASFSLLELRNLDLTQGTHYSALHAKPLLDFAFRSYWQSQLEPEKPLSHLEQRAARIWQTYMDEVNQIFTAHGIADTSEMAWKQVAEANEKDPNFRKTLQTLIRKTTQSIRLELVATKGEERLKRFLSVEHCVLPEPLGQVADRIYLSEQYRKKLGVGPGESVVLEVNGKKKEVVVAQAKLRGNGDVDEQPRWRLSQTLLRELDIPLGLPVTSSYDQRARTLTMTTWESRNRNEVLERKPRTILAEPLGTMTNRVYMTYDDRQRFGVELGEEITLRVGQVQRKVLIAQAKVRPETGEPETPESGNWRLASNIFSELKLPQGIKLRSRFDRERKELSFGPLIGVLNRGESSAGEKLFEGRNKMLKALRRTSAEVGGLMMVIDPNAPENETFEGGIVTGYLDDGSGGWIKTGLPFPDVIYDRDVNWLAGPSDRFEVRLQKALGRPVDLQYVFPPKLQELTVDKMAFERIVRKSEYLSRFLVDSEPLTNTHALQDFMEKHEKVFLKPTSSQQGEGLIRVERRGKTYYYEYPHKVNGQWTVEMETVLSVDELLNRIKGQMRGRPYLMQQYIEIAEIEVPTPRDTNPSGERGIELRLLVQRGSDRKIDVTGVVARMIDRKLTGPEYQMDGRAALELGFDPEHAQHIFTQAKRVAIGVSRLVEQHLNAPVGEVTLDLVVAGDGALYLLEANSKATTRAMFNEVENKDAENACITNPMYYAASIAGFN